jgi:hypothetical protein
MSVSLSKSRAVDRAVYVYNQRHGKQLRRRELDRVGSREVRANLADRRMDEQIGELHISPMKIRH